MHYDEFLLSDLWNESQTQKKNSKRKTDPFNPDRRRKPTAVTGPYIVYMLKDVDIIDDWTAIKKVSRDQKQIDFGASGPSYLNQKFQY